MPCLLVFSSRITKSYNTFHFYSSFTKKYNNPSLKERYTSFIKEGYVVVDFYMFYSSSSSSAPTSSGSALSSSTEGSSSSSVGAVTVATAVSSSSRISYLSDFGKSATVI